MSKRLISLTKIWQVLETDTKSLPSLCIFEMKVIRSIKNGTHKNLVFKAALVFLSKALKLFHGLCRSFKMEFSLGNQVVGLQKKSRHFYLYFHPHFDWVKNLL